MKIAHRPSPILRHCWTFRDNPFRRVCNNLIVLEYLEPVDNPRHKRSKLMRLSSEGRAALSKTLKNEHRIIERTVPDIPSAKVIEAFELLRQIRTSIEIHFNIP